MMCANASLLMIDVDDDDDDVFAGARFWQMNFSFRYEREREIVQPRCLFFWSKDSIFFNNEIWREILERHSSVIPC